MFKMARELVPDNKLEMSSIERLCNLGEDPHEYMGDFEYGRVFGVRRRLGVEVIEVSVDYGNDEHVYGLPGNFVVEVLDDNDIEPDWTHDLHGEVKRARELRVGDRIDIEPTMYLMEDYNWGWNEKVLTVSERRPGRFWNGVCRLTNWYPGIETQEDVVLVSGFLGENLVAIDLFVHETQAFKIVEDK